MEANRTVSGNSQRASGPGTRESASLSDRAGPIRGLILDVDGVLTDGRLYYTAQGEGMKVFHVRDGSALRLWKALGGRVAIVSGRSSEAVVRRARELQVDLVIQGVTDKGATLETVCGQLGLEAAAWCAVGDDWLDLPLLSRTGLAAAPADAVAEVRQRVDYVTEAPGGQGVVHQVVEWLLRLQGRWETAWSLLAWPHAPPTLPQANG